MSGDVEVCIVSYDSARHLESTLTHLASAIPDATVAIQEHGTDADARRVLEDVVTTCPLAVRVQEDASNPGFGAGCNALASGSSAVWLLFLNPDAEVLSWPWTSADPPPRDTIVGPEMVESGDPGRHYGVRFGVAEEVRRSWFRRRGPRPTGRGFVSGSALLVDRAAFERIGRFDEGFFLFYEDIDLCLRANAAGVATEVDGRWRVRHAGAHSTRARFASALQWSYESACRFHQRHGSNVAIYRTYVVADAGLRALLATVRRDGSRRRAYLQLARTALRDLVSAPAGTAVRPGTPKDR